MGEGYCAFQQTRKNDHRDHGFIGAFASGF